jgi:UDP-N-acetylmuramoyl-tripeptide--D-alanyl-D-alanine ligase
MRLTADEIARRAGGEVVAGDPNAAVTAWGFDSRAVLPGSCFLALKDHRDGHDFVADAFRAGASVALIAHEVSVAGAGEPATLVKVQDVVAGLQAIARSVRATRHDLRVVAITGSTGKTSTKDLLSAALPDGVAYANPESFNNEFGLPVTLLNTPASVRGVVAEMGERHPGDIALLCDIARPQYGIVTNVGLAHAEHLGGREGVAAVLGELLESLPETGYVLLPADDPWTPRLRGRTRARVETVGEAEDADHRISAVDIGRGLLPEFVLGGCRFRIGLRGVQQVMNAAMAAVMARAAFDVPFAEAAERMEAARGSRWRMELVESPSGVVVLNDAYNANPSSMAAALRALAQLGVSGRRIAVLGDMRELGAHSDRAHEAVGHLAGEVGADIVIGVGDGGAIVSQLVAPGDAVLVKASRALGLQLVAARLLEAAP